MIYQLRRETWVPGKLDSVFAFFSAPENLGEITPRVLHFRILNTEPIVMRPGAEIDYTIRIHGVPVHWKTIIETWTPPREFVDIQARGPYKFWHHTHRFREKDGGVALEDIVDYALPFGPLGRLAHFLFVQRDVENIFDYRARRIQELMRAPVSSA